MKFYGYCPICEVEIKVKTDIVALVKYCPICKHHLTYQIKKYNANKETKKYEQKYKQKTKKEIS